MYEQTTSAPATDHQAVFALNELITATRGLAQGLSEATRALHADNDLSVSARSVMIALRQRGARTVPDLARAKGVSRQYVQTVINGLLKRELVEARPNPAHRRSRLMALTPQGIALIRDVMRKEGQVLSGLGAGLTVDEIRGAARVLQRIRSEVNLAAGGDSGS